MKWKSVVLVAAFAVLLAGCEVARDSRAPLSMHVIALNVGQLPGNDKWNDLVGRPIIAMEYATNPNSAMGGRMLYLYDARTGECRSVINAPANPGDPVLIAWTPCK